ncbi:hypothetical protein GCM10010211_55060 [Streptomyces albospinus]|uniref:Uncharacterized protein n=1 Tax=Streptomyces albospinus TaxID=285515 RepID=A0ABQ2VDV2_9ACTN|nr:hypothetical protein GCM10010211_55060 [Streptomyces albospinus]
MAVPIPLLPPPFRANPDATFVTTTRPKGRLPDRRSDPDSTHLGKANLRTRHSAGVDRWAPVPTSGPGPAPVVPPG